MSVTLTNPRKESFTFTLYHSVYCAAGAPCDCLKDNVLRPVDGGLKYVDVINPVGVYFESGETRQFHEAVLQIQQVATAIAKGVLKKIDIVEKTILKDTAITIHSAGQVTQNTPINKAKVETEKTD